MAQAKRAEALRMAQLPQPEEWDEARSAYLR
jgi:hypothetical protein